MRRPRPHIPQRRRFFLDCEGQSEQGCGTLVARIAREYPGIHVFVDVKVLNPGAGNPGALVEKAVQIIAERKSHTWSRRSCSMWGRKTKPGFPD